MMISENSYTINQHGNLKIPSRELIAMGLFSGMLVLFILTLGPV